MSNREIDSLYTSIAEKKNWFLNLIQSQSEENNSKPLGKDEWSLLEIIEHLCIVDEVFVHYINSSLGQKKRNSLKQAMQILVVNFVLNNGIKVPVPSEKAHPKGGLISEALIVRWKNVGNTIEDILSKKSDDDLNQICFLHPRAGKLNLIETLNFINNHLNYHVIRAKRLMNKISKETKYL